MSIVQPLDNLHPLVEVTCFVPALNEARGIAITLRALDRALGELARGHELVVVDDASRDNTAELVEAMDNPRIRVHRYRSGPSFRGNLGSSMLGGRGTYVMYADADLLVEPGDIRTMLEAMRRGQDVVVASRYHPDAQTLRGPFRRGLSLAYNSLVRSWFDSPILDHQCGLKLFRREVLEEVLPPMDPQGASRGWFWDAELLIRALWAGYEVREVPVHWKARPASRSMLWKQYRMLPWMIRLWRERPR